MNHPIEVLRRLFPSPVRVAVSTLVLAACAGASTDRPPPEFILGKYTYQETGRLAKYPWKVDAALVLDRDAQFTLDVNFNIDNDDEHETYYGTYRVEGHKVILDHADGSDDGEVHEFVIEGNRLKPRLGWGTRIALKGLRFNPVFVKAE